MTDVLARFKALPQDAQDEILEKHRDWNVDGGYDWWENVYNDFREDMEAKGVFVERMYFSGFWSQGDGACFEGHVQDWPLFIRSNFTGEEAELHLLIHREAEAFSLAWHHRGHYYHENCTRFVAEFYLDEPYDPAEQPLRAAVIAGLKREWENTNFFDQVEEIMKSHMRQLYKNLEEEHDYLTSDEAVLESLISNDMLEEEIDAYESENADCADDCVG